MSSIFGEKMKKTLIGVGCSHTQGCAIEKNGKLLSQQLKDLYNREEVSPEWITENFSWIGCLGNLLNVDEKINFGFGGRGVEQCSRALKNYSYKKVDLSNHLIIFQIPSLDRVEILNSYNDKFVLTESIKYLHKNQRQDFFENYYDTNYYQYKFINELYFLQNYLQSLGAKIYFFDLFTPIRLKDIKDYSKEVVDTLHNNLNWSLELNKNIELDELISSLNLLKLSDNPNLVRLSQENLLDDNHLSETGNRNLAKLIYKEIKNETTFT